VQPNSILGRAGTIGNSNASAYYAISNDIRNLIINISLCPLWIDFYLSLVMPQWPLSVFIIHYLVLSDRRLIINWNLRIDFCDEIDQSDPVSL